MPYCIICQDSKTQFRVLHAPVFPQDAPLNARAVAHCVCTDCAAGLSTCPVCRCAVHPSIVVIEEEDHKCGHLFAVRDSHGNLPASSFAFCGTSCGTASYCHHHGGEYADLPDLPEVHSNDDEEGDENTNNDDDQAALQAQLLYERQLREQHEVAMQQQSAQLLQQQQLLQQLQQQVQQGSQGRTQASNETNGMTLEEVVHHAEARLNELQSGSRVLRGRDLARASRLARIAVRMGNISSGMSSVEQVTEAWDTHEWVEQDRSFLFPESS